MRMARLLPKVQYFWLKWLLGFGSWQQDKRAECRGSLVQIFTGSSNKHLTGRYPAKFGILWTIRDIEIGHIWHSMFNAMTSCKFRTLVFPALLEISVGFWPWSQYIGISQIDKLNMCVIVKTSLIRVSLMCVLFGAIASLNYNTFKFNNKLNYR